jgi:hypothetical protein
MVLVKAMGLVPGEPWRYPCNLAVSIPFGSMLIILFYFHLIPRFTKVVNGLSLKESVLLFNPKTFPQNIFFPLLRTKIIVFIFRYIYTSISFMQFSKNTTRWLLFCFILIISLILLTPFQYSKWRTFKMNLGQSSKNTD